MSETAFPCDHEARQSALKVNESFIVQAPAGSGKTGLLTQRFLHLLASVESPEEIVAITFTRKAAGEMRDRILAALHLAQQEAPPTHTHERLTWQLARAALEQDQRQGWNLLANPLRLGIQTIDSLCQSLVRQMPLLSQFGAVPAVTEDAQPLYIEAAESVIAQLDSGDELADAICQLLQHRDNRVDELQALIADMLARRDQWLRHVVQHALGMIDAPVRRRVIEHVLQSLVEEALDVVRAALPDGIAETLPPLARFAAGNLASDSALRHCNDMHSLPGRSYSELDQWLGIAALLQTKNGKASKWRSPRGINIKLGFPKPSDGATREQQALYADNKQAMQSLLESLQDDDAFCRSLAALTALPAARYADEEWQLLDDLFRLLVYAVGHLQTVFARQGTVDFIEMALRADEAMGDEDAPTDLSLRLDYQLRHLLVDEFQDTSQNQFNLFRKLVAGWSCDDGRTLFLVGDPMQSIYRFREAEVGLFLQAWEGALGNVPLRPLKLSVNFRSQCGIIDWVNSAFPAILPARSDKVRGAVGYTPSDAYRPMLPGDAVKVHPFFRRDDLAEARQVIEIIRQSLAEMPTGTIAILLRSKAHVAEIVGLLKQNNMSFQAVEIDSLAQRPVVQDLLALSCGLIHLADRISWLAMLRAPWCGLTLTDLHALAGQDHDRTIMDLLADTVCTMQLSDDGRARIARILPVLQTVLRQRGRQRLRLWLEGAWIALGGPAGLHGNNDVEDARVYFQLLDVVDECAEPVSPELLHRRVSELYARPDVDADNRLQIMTMHKAKGLEFDTVILPGLGKVTGRDRERLLYWLERTGPTGEPELVFGPIRATQENNNRTADYIKLLDAQKSLLENGRLLYVASTRARQRLHLLGHVDTNEAEEQLRPPSASSLLATLWPVVETQYAAQYECLRHEGDEHGVSLQETRPVLRRLASDWQCPAPPAGIDVATEIIVAPDLPLEFDWASETARLVGTVVHRLLEHLCEYGGALEHAAEVSRLTDIGRNMLQNLGLPREQLEEAVARVRNALQGILNDERGRWLLAATHTDDWSEYAISHVVDGSVRHLVVDRTFIDDQGTRWIIDYKSGSHSGGGLDEFLDREQQRYREQLEGYAAAITSLEDRPVRLGLYFPLVKGWREWPYRG